MSNAPSSTAGHSLNLGQLSEYLRTQLDGSIEVQSAQAFASGASNLTYRLGTTRGPYVLRSKPRGRTVTGAHAIDREYRVLGALSQSDLPVPQVFVSCEDREVIGVEFYLMEHVEGRVLRDYTLAELSRSERSAVYDSMNDVLARLHALDPVALGLGDYGRAGNYFQRQINLWERQYRAQPRSIPEFERLIGWLTEHVIRSDVPHLVHGDYTLHNIVLAPDRPDVVAVLDWELSTLGHPLADLAYNLSQWYARDLNRDAGVVSLIDADVAALGIPTMRAYAQRYAERRGIQIPLRELYYSIAHSRFRLAGILIGIVARIASGTAANESGNTAEALLTPTIEQAWEFAALAERCGVEVV